MLTAYCSSTPALHAALPDRVPGAESAESAATVPLPSLNFHQCASVEDGVGVTVGVGDIVNVAVGVGLEACVGVGPATGVGVGVGVGLGTDD